MKRTPDPLEQIRHATKRSPLNSLAAALISVGFPAALFAAIYFRLSGALTFLMFVTCIVPPTVLAIVNNHKLHNMPTQKMKATVAGRIGNDITFLCEDGMKRTFSVTSLSLAYLKAGDNGILSFKERNTLGLFLGFKWTK